MITEERVLEILEKNDDPVVINLYDAIKHAREDHYTEEFMNILVRMGIREIDNKRMEEERK